MSGVTVAEKHYLDYRLIVEYDESCESPREWCPAGNFITWDNRYNSPDDNPFSYPQEFEEWWEDSGKGGVCLPVYKYEHGGVAFSTGPFSCQWDSGQVGYIYVTADEIAHEWGGVQDLLGLAEECLTAEVETYSKWANGECYGFVLQKSSTCDHGETHWDTVESVWGMIGYDEPSLVDFIKDCIDSDDEALAAVEAMTEGVWL